MLILPGVSGNMSMLYDVGETGGNCNIFHIHAHYVEHVFY